MRYRKLPVEIEAIQYVAPDPERGETGNVAELLAFGAPVEPTGHWGDGDWNLYVGTLEDGSEGRAQVRHVASPGDFIIKGVSGEFYPCRGDIFRMTYEAAE